MNILFLSLIDIPSIQARDIYSDILRELADRGHQIYCISPIERRRKEPSKIVYHANTTILRIKTGNIQKTNIIEKGISTLLLSPQIIRSLKRYFNQVSFNLVLYPTPPITFEKVVRYIKKRDGAAAYLMLKDIFPQNSVDLGMIRKDSLIHRLFLRKEKRLYGGADYIGCMSAANVRYLLEHNPQIPPGKVEICPNSLAVKDQIIYDKHHLKKEYEIPEDTLIFLYGGNLGKPQDVGFICKCLELNMNFNDRFFIICGDGTDYPQLERFVNKHTPQNVKLMRWLPKEKYDALVACCDVGLIFLDHRFTIPNFPSRLLSYLESAKPVLACTDNASDIGQVAVNGGFGWRCESSDAVNFTSLVEKTISLKSELHYYGQAGRLYIEQHYTASKSANIILRHFGSEGVD